MANRYDPNFISLGGRLTGDPTAISHTKDGKPYTVINIANNRGEDSANFFRIPVFGDQAIPVATYLKKGRYVMVEGRLGTRKNTTLVEGKSITMTEIVGARVFFMPDGQGQKKDGSPSSSAPAQMPPIDDEIPF